MSGRGSLKAADAGQRFFCFFARLFAARLSFFMRASTDTTREPFVAPLGADVALRTPLFDFDATT